MLDHETYDWQPAKPALDLLKQRDIPLVLVSSKTLSELADYRVQLGLAHPVVAENGAAIFAPDNYFSGSTTVAAGTVTREQLQKAYAAAKSANEFNCEAFFELGIKGIVDATGLSTDQATMANDRAASEPILWLDSERNAAKFESLMRSHGFRCTRGGRFLHLMADTGKDSAVRQLLDAYAAKWPAAALQSVSLGDGPNDLAMLATTDIAVVIPGKHPHDMNLQSTNRVVRPTLPGPAGWNDAIIRILSEH